MRNMDESPTPATDEPTRRETTVDEWIAALESGRYAKGRKTLCRNRTNYCCLGVLADLDGTLEHRPAGEADGTFGYVYGKADMYAGANHSELRRFLYGEVGHIGDIADHLAGVNDDSDTFAPVVAEIRRLYAEWKAAQPEGDPDGYRRARGAANFEAQP